ncbi:MAG TPA: NRDE family protein [Orrella sp.]
MCLAVLAINAHPDWPLIVAANRDEYHARPTQSMHPWPEKPDLLAGKDLLAGGTWLGVTTSGRFALLTNVRDPAHHQHHAPSRGALIPDFLGSQRSTTQHLDTLAQTAHQYNGFNLIAQQSDGQIWHASNYQTPFAHPMTAGVHGIANALLNTPWPKTQRTTKALTTYLRSTTSMTADVLVDLLIDIMGDTTPVDDALLPSTGISLPRERLLSTPFIVSPDYGTRCSTFLFRHRNANQWVQEDSYDATGTRIGRLRYGSVAGEPWRAIDAGPGSFSTD